MSEIKQWVLALLGMVVRVALWGFAALLALGLLALALVFLLVGGVWVLLTGRRLAPPVFVGRYQRYARERVWPGGSDRGSTSSTEGVDVEERQIEDDPKVRPPGGGG